MDSEEVWYVPVVVHVVYTSTRENISLEQIQSQLTAVNNDFRRRNADTVETLDVFKSVAADVRIEFYLTRIDDGIGIIRIPSAGGSTSIDNIHYTASGGSDAIDPLEHLNIWIANIPGEIFAYTKNAPEFPLEEEGIVIDFRHFGTEGTAEAPFNKGRTLTHEIGHYLGLSHPFHIDDCTDADLISDTPPQRGPSFNCDLTRESCGSIDMVQNFMNLADDDCMNFFTRGQADAMRATLLTEKSGILKKHRPLTTFNDPEMETAIFPNPTTGGFSVKSNSLVQVISLRDVSGRLIEFDTQIGTGSTYVTPASCQPGVHFVSIKTKKGTSERRVIFK